MLDISPYLQSLRARDFPNFLALIDDIAKDIADETKEVVASDNLQDCLMYLLVASDLCDRDLEHLQLLNLLYEEVSYYHDGKMAFNLMSLFVSCTGALSIKRDNIKFGTYLEYQEIMSHSHLQAKQVGDAIEKHTEFYSSRYREVFPDKNKFLRPYRLKESIEERISALIDNTLEQPYSEDFYDFLAVIAEALRAHDKVTPYLALYLQDTVTKAKLRISKREKKDLLRIFNAACLKALDTISRYRETDSYHASTDALESYCSFILSHAQNKKYARKMIVDNQMQRIRFFINPLELYKLESKSAELRQITCRTNP